MQQVASIYIGIVYYIYNILKGGHESEACGMSWKEEREKEMMWLYFN